MRMVVAGCVGAAAVACACYWYGGKFTADDEEEEEQRTDAQNRTLVTCRQTEFPDLSNFEVITGFFYENT